MKKYAKIINEETKQCDVGLGNYPAYYESLNMRLMDVEQGYNGKWYVAGYLPVKPVPSYQEKRQADYPNLSDQLDMIYWDKINGTHLWQDKITAIKTKYPKV